MFNSTSDENVSVSDVHIGLDTSSHDLEYIEEDYTNSTYEDLNNFTTKDYCLVSSQSQYCWVRQTYCDSCSICSIMRLALFSMGCSYESSLVLIMHFKPRFSI